LLIQISRPIKGFSSHFDDRVRSKKGFEQASLTTPDKPTAETTLPSKKSSLGSFSALEKFKVLLKTISGPTSLPNRRSIKLPNFFFASKDAS
tara:strand:- start:108042 stop:108317 length:276 start_codon:yes stop_codon:yes gene_type:complete